MKRIIAILLLGLTGSCNQSPNDRVARELAGIAKNNDIPTNVYSSTVRARYFDSLSRATGANLNPEIELALANAWLEKGEEEKSIKVLENLLKVVPAENHELQRSALKLLGISWLRYGERTNCVINHSMQSCIFPIQGSGVHADQTGSERAIEIYQQILAADSSDLEARWLLNIAYMTIGGYPDQVPSSYLIPLPDNDSASVKPFEDMAMNLGLNINNLAGGGIVEDFDNDGYLDIVTSSWSLRQGMHFFRNNGDGTFTDVAKHAGIDKITGGLNIMQTDYNNDGFKDIFVVRGAWLQSHGKEPKSLLRNNGDGTFTDVTRESGIISYKPSQTAVWADFNNDGWLDVYIGHENSSGEPFASELYINNQNGTFSQVADKCGVLLLEYVKGVTAGDFDNDGWTDLFVSCFSGKKILFKNMGAVDGLPRFNNV